MCAWKYIINFQRILPGSPFKTHMKTIWISNVRTYAFREPAQIEFTYLHHVWINGNKRMDTFIISVKKEICGLHKIDIKLYSLRSYVNIIIILYYNLK